MLPEYFKIQLHYIKVYTQYMYFPGGGRRRKLRSVCYGRPWILSTTCDNVPALPSSSNKRNNIRWLVLTVRCPWVAQFVHALWGQFWPHHGIWRLKSMHFKQDFVPTFFLLPFLNKIFTYIFNQFVKLKSPLFIFLLYS